MNTPEGLDYEKLFIEKDHVKLNRDPFGKRIMRAISENSGKDHDYFNDPEIIMRAAKHISRAKSPEDQQLRVATIIRDLTFLQANVLQRELSGIQPVINDFMGKVEDLMRLVPLSNKSAVD